VTEPDLTEPDLTEPEFLKATRTSYDAVAADYFARYRDALQARPLDRGMLAGFAELVLAAGAGAGAGAGTGQVADIGCGPGQVTAHLTSLGLSAFGIDLSPQMVSVARRSHPGLRFEQGSMLALDLPDGGLGGVLAWYSTIHVPDDRLPEAFAEFHRVLAPGGYLLLGFQAGDKRVHRTEGLGHEISLVFQHRQPGHVAGLLSQAGLAIRAQLQREPDEDGDFPEQTPQAFVLARKPHH
jgi:SAM-dependent methyltransferase